MRLKIPRTKFFDVVPQDIKPKNRGQQYVNLVRYNDISQNSQTIVNASIVVLEKEYESLRNKEKIPITFIEGRFFKWFNEKGLSYVDDVKNPIHHFEGKMWRNNITKKVGIILSDLNLHIYAIPTKVDPEFEDPVDVTLCYTVLSSKRIMKYRLAGIHQYIYEY